MISMLSVDLANYLQNHSEHFMVFSKYHDPTINVDLLAKKIQEFYDNAYQHPALYPLPKHLL